MSTPSSSGPNVDALAQIIADLQGTTTSEYMTVKQAAAAMKLDPRLVSKAVKIAQEKGLIDVGIAIVPRWDGTPTRVPGFRFKPST